MDIHIFPWFSQRQQHEILLHINCLGGRLVHLKEQLSGTLPFLTNHSINRGRKGQGEGKLKEKRAKICCFKQRVTSCAVYSVIKWDKINHYTPTEISWCLVLAHILKDFLKNHTVLGVYLVYMCQSYWYITMGASRVLDMVTVNKQPPYTCLFCQLSQS